MPDPTPRHPPSTPSGGLRPAVERMSMPLLTRLGQLPTWLPTVVMMALILVGAFVGGPVGFALIVLALLVLTWLLYLAWPQLPVPMRLMRIAVLALVLAIALTRLFPN